MSGMLKTVSKLFRVGNARYMVGRDLEGNKYFELPSLSGSQDPRHTRRIIEYRIKKPMWDYDTSALPPQWKMWLRKTRRSAPTLEELEQDQQRLISLQANVRMIEERDERSRREMELKRLEAGEIETSQETHPVDSTAYNPREAQRDPPSLGETPDQGSSQAEASARAPEAAQRFAEATDSSPAEDYTPKPRVRGRSRISAVPTSEVVDEDAQQARARRVPVSRTTNREDAHTRQGQQLAGTVQEERTPDLDVWKASQSRIKNQEQGVLPDSSGGRRSYCTTSGRRSGPLENLGKARSFLACSQPGLHFARRLYSTGPVRPSRPGQPPVYRQMDSPRRVTAERVDSAMKQTPLLVWGASAVVIVLGMTMIYILPTDALDLRSHMRTDGISPRSWTALDIIGSTTATSPSDLSNLGDGNHRLVTLSLPTKGAAPLSRTNSDHLAIHSINVKQPDIQIERSYTPLQTPAESRAEGKLDLLVKKYEDGEVGRYIHSLAPGQNQLEVRGWLRTWDQSWMYAGQNQGGQRQPLDEVVLVVGGTGIAPAYQLLSSSLGHSTAPALPPQPSTSEPSPKPTFKVMYAAPKESSLLLLPELRALQASHPDRLKVGVWLDEREDGSWLTKLKLDRVASLFGVTLGGIEGLPSTKTGRITQSDLTSWLGPLAKPAQDNGTPKPHRAILVCGPEGMVEAIAGPRARDGKSQGDVGGLLAKVGARKGEVWKL